MILDLHIHTSWHSADSNLSPIDLIHEAKRLGLDGVVVTEHDRGWDRFRARDLAGYSILQLLFHAPIVLLLSWLLTWTLPYGPPQIPAP